MITNNCIGTFLYHRTGAQFLSPTINLQILPEDYVRFAENLGHYITCEIEEFTDQDVIDERFYKYTGTVEHVPFPVGKLDDILLYFQHYKSIEEAKGAWYRRAKRINYDKICCILAPDNIDADTLERFRKLPYKRFIVARDKNWLDGISSTEGGYVKSLWLDVDGDDVLRRQMYEQIDWDKVLRCWNK